jgi:hypothetical protein
VDNLPAAVESPDAAVVVFDTVLRFLRSALQTLVVAMCLLLVGGLAAGPSRPATAVRRFANRGIDALARLLAKAGNWTHRTARALSGVRAPLQVLFVVVGFAGLIVAHQPQVATLLWVAVGVMVALLLLEVVVRVSALP